MYITLFIIVLIVGLLMVLLPSKAIKNLVNQPANKKSRLN